MSDSQRPHRPQKLDSSALPHRRWGCQESLQRRQKQMFHATCCQDPSCSGTHWHLNDLEPLGIMMVNVKCFSLITLLLL